MIKIKNIKRFCVPVVEASAKDRSEYMPFMYQEGEFLQRKKSRAIIVETEIVAKKYYFLMREKDKNEKCLAANRKQVAVEKRYKKILNIYDNPKTKVLKLWDV